MLGPIHQLLAAVVNVYFFGMRSGIEYGRVCVYVGIHICVAKCSTCSVREKKNVALQVVSRYFLTDRKNLMTFVREERTRVHSKERDNDKYGILVLLDLNCSSLLVKSMPATFVI